MCTAVSYYTKDHYFGRNLDLECSYNEEVVITPRKFPFPFKYAKTQNSHYAIIGMAHISKDYPLYYDAINETGLGIAALNFPENACYKPMEKDKNNIAPFEVIPYVLGNCKNVSEAEAVLKNFVIVNENFSAELVATPLHWMITDKERSVVLEQTSESLKLYDNPAGVLTNNPTFDIQLFNLNNYMSLSCNPPKNSFSEKLELKTYSRGMGAIGLPGDLSSVSRFVRASFLRANSISDGSEKQSVNQFFHILGGVEQQRGCVVLENGEYEITLYSSCCNLDKGIYYYKTYDNLSITKVDMYKSDINGEKLIRFPLKTDCVN